MALQLPTAIVVPYAHPPPPPPPPPLPLLQLTDLGVPLRPGPGELFFGPVAAVLRMLESPQFNRTHQLLTVIEDLKGINTIEARHGQPEAWTASVGCAPTADQEWKLAQPLFKVGARHVALSCVEYMRHGPCKGTDDVGMPYFSSGLLPPVELQQRLETAIGFMARYRKDPGRGDEHEAWAAGSHRMAGRRANPLDTDIGNYAPVDKSLLLDEAWLALERDAEGAYAEWLAMMDAELRRVCPTHHARSNTPRDHTHNYSGGQRVAPWNAPQTTAACAVNFPAFGHHADRNAGFLSPYLVIIPERLRERQQRSPSEEQACSPCMQYINALTYTGEPSFWFNPDCLHAFRPQVGLLTECFYDYVQRQPRREAPQNAAWKAARATARESARRAIVAEAGQELEEGELELRVQLECGPLPMAGLVQERCLSHMGTQQGDTTQAATAGRMSQPKAPKRQVDERVQVETVQRKVTRSAVLTAREERAGARGAKNAL
jgi:hypothetical protein